MLNPTMIVPSWGFGESVSDVAVVEYEEFSELTSRSDPHRVFRRLHSLRGWRHGKTKQILPGGPRAGGPADQDELVNEREQPGSPPHSP